MNIQKLEAALNNFIHEQYITNPKVTELDKAALVVGKRLGYCDVNYLLSLLLGKDFIKKSPTLWLDENCTDINIDVLKGIIEDLLVLYPSYIYEGISFEFLFKQYNVLGGYKIDRLFVDTLYRHIDQQGV